MRYRYSWPASYVGRLALILLVPIAPLILMSAWIGAALGTLIFGNLVIFLARTRARRAELTHSAVLLEYGFGPALLLPYDRIAGVEERSAGILLPQRVLVKVRG